MTDQQPKALTALEPAVNKQEMTSLNSTNLSPSARISLNDKGQFTISAAGSQKVEKAFLGSSAEYEAAPHDSTSLDNVPFAQLVGALPHGRGKCETPGALNTALDGVAALAPRDGMEVMLCSQLVALHSQSMEFLRRGILSQQTTNGVDRNVNRATKLLRSFATITECLRTYRGGGQQKMTVEHVTVQAGGQATVGTVNRGEGNGQKNSE
jgi:hypothetical protein